MEDLGTGEEVVGEVRAVLRVQLELLQRNVQFLKRPASELAGHKREIVTAVDRQGMKVELGHRIVRVRIYSQERHGVKPEDACAPIDDVPGGVAVQCAAGGIGGIQPIECRLAWLKDM